jgi:hypothetical protein
MDGLLLAIELAKWKKSKNDEAFVVASEGELRQAFSRT